jgi:hypothetical protein
MLNLELLFNIATGLPSRIIISIIAIFVLIGLFIRFVKRMY